MGIINSVDKSMIITANFRFQERDDIEKLINISLKYITYWCDSRIYVTCTLIQNV